VISASWSTGPTGFYVPWPVTHLLLTVKEGSIHQAGLQKVQTMEALTKSVLTRSLLKQSIFSTHMVLAGYPGCGRGCGFHCSAG